MTEADKPNNNVPAGGKKGPQESVDQESKSLVGLSKAKKMGVAAVIVVATVFIVYIVGFSQGDEDKQKQGPKPKKETIEKALKESAKAVPRAEDDVMADAPTALPSMRDLSLSIPEPPKPPAPPKANDSLDQFNPFSGFKKSQGQDVQPPSPPAFVPSAPSDGQPAGPSPAPYLPPPPGGQAKQGLVAADKGGLSGKEVRERRSVDVLALNQVGKPSSDKSGSKKRISASSPIRQTSAPQIAATQYGKRDNLIAQGKIIDIVLETAIDTDLKGMTRGIIGKDVYAESGSHILIPRGSRIIGVYSSSLTSGQSRVAIAWNRIIRPDGIDFMLDMVATDAMGRAGVAGEVDHHLPEIMRNSILLSLLTIASGVILTDIFNDNVVTQTVDTQTGDVTTASSSAYQQTQGVMNDIISEIDDKLDSAEPDSQTIRIAQGTVIKAFVSSDIVVPNSALRGYDAKD